MPSFETPPTTPSPEAADHKKRHEAFLSKDQRHINLYLGWVFKYIDEAKKKGVLEKTNDEIEAAKAEGDKDLAFLSQYGIRTFESAIDDWDAKIPKEGREQFLREYKDFCDVVAEPELRVRLLSKMCSMDANDPWEQRENFTRLMYELYGREKVLSRDPETGEEKGFLKLEGQADLVEAWNIKGKWGFSKEEFEDIRKQIPELRERLMKYDDEPLVAPVLTPYLPDKDGMTGVWRTFESLSRLVGAGQQFDQLNNDRQGIKGLRLSKGLTHMPGLALEILGLGDHEGENPESVRAIEKNLPHASVLAAAASSSEWVERNNAWIPGYEAQSQDEELWRYMLGAPFGHRYDDRQETRFSYKDGSAFAHWFVPVRRK